MVHYNLCKFSPNLFFGDEMICEGHKISVIFLEKFNYFEGVCSHLYKEKCRSGFEVKRIESLCNGCFRILLVWFRMFRKKQNKRKHKRIEKWAHEETLVVGILRWGKSKFIIGFSYKIFRKQN